LSSLLQGLCSSALPQRFLVRFLAIQHDFQFHSTEEIDLHFVSALNGTPEAANCIFPQAI
jgi:hypothetical protein